MDDIKNKVLKLAEQVAGEQGVEIFDVELLGKGKLLLRVTIDKEGGVSLYDCERFSRSLESLLDVEGPIPGRYTLEISSPGLDRPLKGIKDFEKNIGKLVRIVTIEKIENRNFFIGRILGISDSRVKVLVNGIEIHIPFEKVSSARLEVEFK
ncbi:MAG: ribosome maturation factor RimP [Nitrospirota bacterium]